LTKDLVTSSCEACRVDAPVLENKEIQELLSQIPSWKVFEEDDTKKIICSFIFLNYDDSRNFLNKVADLAEVEDHHPEIILEWGKVTVTWWSHKIKGLHKNDFICASKTDALFENLHKS
jgi:Pterin-4a-carbinolamine dehydratase